MIILKTRPMVSRYENLVILFNEMTVSVYLYVIMVLNLFLQGKYPASYRDLCGLILISVLIACVGINFLAFLIQVFL